MVVAELPWRITKHWGGSEWINVAPKKWHDDIGSEEQRDGDNRRPGRQMRTMNGIGVIHCRLHRRWHGMSGQAATWREVFPAYRFTNCDWPLRREHRKG